MRVAAIIFQILCMPFALNAQENCPLEKGPLSQLAEILKPSALTDLKWSEAKIPLVEMDRLAVISEPKAMVDFLRAKYPDLRVLIVPTSGDRKGPGLENRAEDGALVNEFKGRLEKMRLAGKSPYGMYLSSNSSLALTGDVQVQRGEDGHYIVSGLVKNERRPQIILIGRNPTRREVLHEFGHYLIDRYQRPRGKTWTFYKDRFGREQHSSALAKKMKDLRQILRKRYPLTKPIELLSTAGMADHDVKEYIKARLLLQEITLEELVERWKEELDVITLTSDWAKKWKFSKEDLKADDEFRRIIFYTLRENRVGIEQDGFFQAFRDTLAADSEFADLKKSLFPFLGAELQNDMNIDLPSESPVKKNVEKTFELDAAPPIGKPLGMKYSEIPNDIRMVFESLSQKYMAANRMLLDAARIEVGEQRGE